MYTYTCIVATCTDLQIQQNGSQAKQSWSRPSLCFHVHCEVGMGQKSQKLDGECQWMLLPKIPKSVIRYIKHLCWSIPEIFEFFSFRIIRIWRWRSRCSFARVRHRATSGARSDGYGHHQKSVNKGVPIENSKVSAGISTAVITCNYGSITIWRFSILASPFIFPCSCANGSFPASPIAQPGGREAPLCRCLQGPSGRRNRWSHFKRQRHRVPHKI